MVTKTTLSLKVGTILIAKKVCRMDSGEKTLTIGKDPILEFRYGTQLNIIDNDGDNHYFDLDTNSEDYYGIFFKIKK